MLQQITPYFGYLASLCLIIALLVSNDLKFRWFNTLGNVFFIIYAIVLQAFPVLLTNVILLGINAFYLIKVYRRQENFDMLEFNGDEKMAQKFLQFYQRPHPPRRQSWWQAADNGRRPLRAAIGNGHPTQATIGKDNRASHRPNEATARGPQDG